MGFAGRSPLRARHFEAVSACSRRDAISPIRSPRARNTVLSDSENSVPAPLGGSVPVPVQKFTSCTEGMLAPFPPFRNVMNILTTYVYDPEIRSHHAASPLMLSRTGRRHTYIRQIGRAPRLN